MSDIEKILNTNLAETSFIKSVELVKTAFKVSGVRITMDDPVETQVTFYATLNEHELPIIEIELSQLETETVRRTYRKNYFPETT